MIALLLALQMGTSPAHASQWVEMFKRQGEPLLHRLGLPDRALALCRAKLDRFEDEFPKNGLMPMGVAQWDTLSDRDFKTAIFGLDQVQTSFLEDCLADVKIRQKAAGL